VLSVVDVRLDHLLDGAGCIAQIAVFCQIDRAHSTAANPADDLVTVVKDLASGKCLGLLSFFEDVIDAGSLR
jgi:hypothetical protein